MIKNIPIRIFELIIRGDRLSSPDHDLLVSESRKSNDYFCGLDPDTSSLKAINKIVDQVEQRSQLLRLVYPEILETLTLQNIQIDPPSTTLPMLWHYWLPLAQSLVHQQEKIGRTFIQGLLGGQGTGKTTLGIVLNILLRHLGKTFLSISLDDLYKTYTERQKLRDRRPELIWRGPPSTHDIDLGIQVLQQLRDRQPNHPQPIAIPRFDKSLHKGAGDRTDPKISYGADIVLFEGWFVGMRPLPISAFRNFIPPILSESDRQFALDCNANLYDYLPLWTYLDSLIVLVPEDYTYSLQWRLEAEHKLINSGKTGMKDEEIIQFVEYFWKALHPELFLSRMINSADRLLGAPITSQINGDRLNGDRPSVDLIVEISRSQSVDLIVEISRSHIPTRIYS